MLKLIINVLAFTTIVLIMFRVAEIVLPGAGIVIVTVSWIYYFTKG